MTNDRLDHLHRRVSSALASWFHDREPGAGLALDEAVRTAVNAAYEAGHDRAIGHAADAVAKLRRRSWFGWVRARDVTAALIAAFEEDRT